MEDLAEAVREWEAVDEVEPTFAGSHASAVVQKGEVKAETPLLPFDKALTLFKADLSAIEVKGDFIS